MPKYCLLDLFSIELLHALFTYFLAHEILLTFSDVSDYVNGVIIAYPAHRLDFKSIKKTHFDLVCRHIQPKQVISLILSDDNVTPGQSQLFLSRFLIEEFTQLQSLTLFKIEFESIISILSNLHELKNLRSFSCDIRQVQYRYSIFNDDHSNESGKLNSLLLSTYDQLPVHLNRLYLSDLSISSFISFRRLKYLRHLECGLNVFTKIKMIFESIPRVQSLHLHLDIHRYFVYLWPCNQLIRLKLIIHNIIVSMKDMRTFLPKCICLKYLEIQANGRNDLVDGNQWEMLTSSLIQFHFLFLIRNFSHLQSLDSFRTSFWLKEKHWYVASQDGRLFSVPHFFPNQIEIPIQSSICTTAPDNRIIYNHINEVIVNSASTDRSIYFPNAKILHLNCSIPIDTHLCIVNLNRIEHLTILSIHNLTDFLPFECRMPRVYHLTISRRMTPEMFRNIGNYRFKQIRKISFCMQVMTHHHLIIEKLVVLFPNIEHLTIFTVHIESIEDMIYIIDRFPNLYHLSIYSNSSSLSINKIISINRKSIASRSRRLTENNFTYRINSLMTSSRDYNINWWIDIKASQSFKINDLLSRRGYFWYRLKYILRPNLDLLNLLLILTVMCILLYTMIHSPFFSAHAR